MPLPPPSESLSYTTRLHIRTQRLEGSWYYPFDDVLWYDVVWFRKIRNWVRVPKGYRHTTNPYTSYVFEAKPPGQFSFTWLNRFPIDYNVYKYDYHVLSGDLVLTGDIEGWLSTRVTVSPEHALLTSVRNSVLRQAAGKKFNAALFATEANKTLDLLVTNARKIARSFQEIRTGKILKRPLKETVRRAMLALGVINSKKWDPKASRASQWLEYRYGVETLMADVRDAAEFAASKMSDQPERYKWRSQKRESSAVTTDYPDYLEIGFLGTHQGGIQQSPKRTFQTMTTAEAWLEAELEVAGYRSMQQLGFANPIGLAWENVPFSFVVDWALDIGSYLEMQSSLWGLKIINAGYSLQCDGYVDVEMRPAPGNDNPGLCYYMSPSFSGTSTRSFRASRYQRWAWVNPSPEYTLGIGLNIKRTLDAVSLLYVNLKRN